jgi:hypothetical protein
MVLPIPVEMRQEEKNRAQVKERQKLITDHQQLRFMDKNVEELFGSLISLNRYAPPPSPAIRQQATQHISRVVDRVCVRVRVVVGHREEARSRGLAPYMVIPIAVLESLARIRPTTEARFRAIEGVDDHKARTYAATFTRAIQVLLLLFPPPLPFRRVADVVCVCVCHACRVVCGEAGILREAWYADRRGGAGGTEARYGRRRHVGHLSAEAGPKANARLRRKDDPSQDGGTPRVRWCVCGSAVDVGP